MKTSQKTFMQIDDIIDVVIRKSDDPFRTGAAQLFGILWADVAKPTVTKIGEHVDIYEMLQNPDNAKAAAKYDSFGVTTCGWAAPLSGSEEDDDIVPSKHPQKRRVRLFVHCDNGDNVSSSIRFCDSDEVVTDENSAQGNMREAILKFNNHIKMEKK